jgi:hypothetical protein
LKSTPPTYCLHPKNAKSRRRDVVPFVFPELVESLNRWRKVLASELGRSPKASERVLRVARHLPGDQFRKDCEYAGIEQTNERGERLDFYAATRHTFCTMLARLRLSVHRQKKLMGHTDIKTTEKYTHIEVEDLVVEPGLLPSFGPLPLTQGNRANSGMRFSAGGGKSVQLSRSEGGQEQGVEHSRKCWRSKG